MDEYALGLVVGQVIIGGLVPFAFIAYGKRRGKSWAGLLGIALGLLTLLGALRAPHIGHALGAALWIFALIVVKAKTPAA